jgi:hypothetical protein
MSKKAKKKAAKSPAKKAPKAASRRAKAAPAAKPGATAAAPKRPSYAMSKRVVTLLRFARKMVTDAAAGIPDERACEQLPGASNHKLWTLGHLAVSNAWFESLLTGKMGDVPQAYNGLFGMGSKPTGDAAAYPPIAEVRGYYDSTLNSLCDAASKLDDEAIGGACAADSGGFATDKLDGLLKAAWHEGWHLGQVATLRRGLGLAPMTM